MLHNTIIESTTTMTVSPQTVRSLAEHSNAAELWTTESSNITKRVVSFILKEFKIKLKAGTCKYSLEQRRFCLKA